MLTFTRWLINRFFSHIQAQFKKNDKCFKCLKKEYRFNDNDVFCKNFKIVIKKEVEIVLSQLSIEWDDIDAKEYESKSFKNAFDEYHSRDENEQSEAKNWKFLKQVALKDFLQRRANEFVN